MSDIRSWSNFANGNDAAAPDGFPESMAPGDVNNAARELMAAMRRQHEQAEWIDLGHEPSFATSNSFTISGDVTAIYHVNRRVRLSDIETLYGQVTASSYSAPSTDVTVALDAGDLSSNLSAVAVAAISGTGGNPSVTPGSIGAASRSMITDIDLDTRVEVERFSGEDKVRITSGGALRAIISGMGITHIGARIQFSDVANFWGSGFNDLNSGELYERVFDVAPGFYIVALYGKVFRTGSLPKTDHGLEMLLSVTTADSGIYKDQSSLQPSASIQSRAICGWTQNAPYPSSDTGFIYGNTAGFGDLTIDGPLLGLANIDSGERLSIALHARYATGFIRLSEGQMWISIYKLTANDV